MCGHLDISLCCHGIIHDVSYVPVPPSVPNKTLVLASCILVKRDVSGMAVAAVFFVRYTTVRSIQNSLLLRIYL